MTEAKPEYLEATYDMFLSSVGSEPAENQRFYAWLQEVEADHAFCFEARHQGAQSPEIELIRTDGTALKVINVSSYNYLGFSHNLEVIEAAKAALDRYGLGAASSPVHGGTFQIHQELEEELVKFLGLEGRGVSLFSSGYAVNTGVISALMKRKHHIVMDRAAHMSIMEGAQLAGSKLHYFEHNDIDDLQRILAEIAPKAKRILVCTEGVFSADGDYGKLADVVRLAKEYGAMVLVDEAHSILVAGANGRGVAEEAGVLEDIDLYVATFSKALGGVGGALIAKPEITRYVNWYAKCRMFSCALDPAVTGGVCKALKLAGGADGAARRKRLKENVHYLRGALQGRVDLGLSESWILTVIYGDEEKTLPLVNYMQHQGLEAGILQFPAVPVNESRIRLFVTSEHTRAQLDRVVEVLLLAAQRFDFSLAL